MLCLCPAATSDDFRVLFQEWMWEGTEGEQKRSSWCWFWYFRTRGSSVGKVVCVCVWIRERKREEGREGGGRGRKRGREILSYYETDCMWLKWVLQGLLVFIDRTTAFPCHRHWLDSRVNHHRAVDQLTHRSNGAKNNPRWRALLNSR